MMYFIRYSYTQRSPGGCFVSCVGTSTSAVDSGGLQVRFMLCSVIFTSNECVDFMRFLPNGTSVLRLGPYWRGNSLVICVADK